MASEVVTERDAWADQTHAAAFDYTHRMPGFLLKQHYENFNEGRLLNAFADDIRGDRMFEIGCATGELYRYIKRYKSRFHYHGFDISAPGITRAQAKFPEGKFYLYDGRVSGVADKHGQPDLVWCRDVVMHQAEPFEFLDQLLRLAGEALLVRLRTRDVGDTVTDPSQSCQLHWDQHWVPYIVVNTDELISRISAHEDVRRIVIARAYEVLGGNNLRYLPKDLYLSAAKAAETAVFIQKGTRSASGVDVTFMDRQDRDRPRSERLLKMGVRRLQALAGRS